MNIIKFNEFIKINENIHDTPEEYIKMALIKIKNKIEKMFAGQTKADDIEKMSDRKNKEDGKTLSDFNVELQSCEISRYSKLQDNVKVKYTDADAVYDLTISIHLEDAIPKDDAKDFSDNDIKKCYIKFKKYDQDQFDLIGEISKTINIKDIDDDFLVSLKIEIDEEFGSGDEEEFKIEFE